MVKKLVKKLKAKIATDNERGARQSLIEDLFYDFHRSRKEVYTMNFIRGIFFGLGSVLGGTVVIALIIWILSATGDIFPPLADFINGIIDAMQRPRQVFLLILGIIVLFWYFSSMVRRKQIEPPLDDEILRVSIDELRRTLDWLHTSYDKVKTKTLTFMGGGLALLTFLYSSGDIFFPSEVYGRIFYVIGLSGVISALVILVLSLLPRRWEFSIDGDDLDEMNFEDTSHYLQYVKNNYLKAYRNNLSTYEKNHRMLNLSFFPLMIGAIILVVLKIFGT